MSLQRYLLLPSAPHNLQLETLHQIAQIYNEKYPKVTGFFHKLFCWTNGNLKRHELAKKLQNVTPEMFDCKSGWLLLANVWLDGHHHVFKGIAGDVRGSGFLSSLIEKCFVSAFNFRFKHNYSSDNYVEEDIYNEMIQQINASFPNNTNRWQL